MNDCDVCHGLGTILLWGGSARSGTLIVEPCPDCNGTGKIKEGKQWTDTATQFKA